jgi:hypothetical protein
LRSSEVKKREAKKRLARVHFEDPGFRIMSGRTIKAKGLLKDYISYPLSAVHNQLQFYPFVSFPFLRAFFFFCGAGAGRNFILIVIEVLGSQPFLDAGGVDDDRGFAVDRAFVFADAAAGAFFFLDDGPFLVIADDGMIGTLLVTDEADFIRIPGNAPRLVDVGDPHLKEAFFLDGKWPDGFRGTDPSAKIAELLTVADTGNEPRCVKTSQARFQKGRLKGIIGTHLQTFAAACAHGNKFFFRERSRRSNQPVIFQSALGLEGVGFDHQC